MRKDSGVISCRITPAYGIGKGIGNVALRLVGNDD